MLETLDLPVSDNESSEVSYHCLQEGICLS